MRVLLEMEEDFKVVGLAENGLQAVEICHKFQPDIVLMGTSLFI